MEARAASGQPAWLRHVIRFLCRILLCFDCCEDEGRLTRDEHERLPGDAGFRRVPSRSRPSELEALQSRADTKLSPQDKQFASMRKPSFTTAPYSGKPEDEDACAVCLEEFTAHNPRVHFPCGHAFHLACMLEWQEHGHTHCPVCHVAVDDLDES